MNTEFGQILDVFSPDEISNMVRILSRIEMQNYGRKDTYNNGFTEQDPIYFVIKKIVIDKINSICPVKINRVAEGMQLITKNPYSIHTDFAHKNDSGNGTAYLIPLWTKPATEENSFTVIFNQRFKGNNLADYIRTNPPLSDEPAHAIWDQVPNAHLDPDFAKYLSVALIAWWQPGSLIYWNRELFHSSDDFRKKGIDEKSALVIFSTNDG